VGGGPCDGGLTSLVRDLEANELSKLEEKQFQTPFANYP
jgi:hypothetical protein